MAKVVANVEVINDEELKRRVDIYNSVENKSNKFLKDIKEKLSNEHQSKIGLNNLLYLNTQELNRLYALALNAKTNQEFQSGVNYYTNGFEILKKILETELNKEDNNRGTEECFKKIGEESERKMDDNKVNVNAPMEDEQEEVEIHGTPLGDNPQNEEEKNKKITELLQNLASIQAQLTILRARSAKNKLNGIVDKKVSNMRKYLEDAARKYGQNKTNIQDIISDYEQALKTAQEDHERNIKKDTLAQGHYEAEEIRYTGELSRKENDRREYMKSEEYSTYKREYKNKEKEAKRAMKSGDLETAQKIIGELSKLYEESKICAYDEKISALKAKIKYNRDKIDECKANIDGADKVFESKVENVEDNKEKRLAEIEKQSAINKLFGFIYSKIGGKKKFTERVINPVKEKISAMAKKIEQKATKSKESFASAIKGMVQKTRTSKENIINDIKGKVINATEKRQEKINKYNQENQIESENEL
ncbi:MAG TPA: hypothetical protein OIM45_07820 [Clostridiaceae bacterium]|nr:hypothetical protein [Clostridiaceae bacterium]